MRATPSDDDLADCLQRCGAAALLTSFGASAAAAFRDSCVSNSVPAYLVGSSSGETDVDVLLELHRACGSVIAGDTNQFETIRNLYGRLWRASVTTNDSNVAERNIARAHRMAERIGTRTDLLEVGCLAISERRRGHGRWFAAEVAVDFHLLTHDTEVDR